MKYLVRLVIFGAACVWLSIFCRAQTDGFKICKISSDLPFSPEWETTPNNIPFIKKALSQPFSYLARGSQAFVFASQDGQYVIKLIRYNHIQPSFWEKMTSPEKCKALEEKFRHDFTSYKIAYEELQEETGLLCIHLNKTDLFCQNLVIVDKLGISHTLDLDKTEFILQKRAEPLYPHIKKLMNQEQEEMAKTLISHLIFLLSHQSSKGIMNSDVDLFKNFGCLENQVIELDVGSLKKGFQDKEELLKVTECLHQRLSQDYPSLDAHLLKELSS